MANGEALSDARQMALTLARSGRFCGWRLIEIELRFIRGLAIAQGFFHDLKLRDELDSLCRAAQRQRRRQTDLPPVPQYRFRGGELRRPPVIRFLTDADGRAPANDPSPPFAGVLLGAE
ncbi:hypothetical protein V5F38_11840 [Xanthobacter sp. V0B-10]|uniref:hypothetical protein n=1 Tax=Xanthobacter albus TaxID=3119929 RepID=UPI00372AADD7